MPDATEKPKMTPKYISEIEGRVRLEMADCSLDVEIKLDELFRLANVGLLLETGRIGTTHWDGCWDSGHRHYPCALERIEELEAQRAKARD